MPFPERPAHLNTTGGHKTKMLYLFIPNGSLYFYVTLIFCTNFSGAGLPNNSRDQERPPFSKEYI